jgi:hypothetical protein
MRQVIWGLLCIGILGASACAQGSAQIVELIARVKNMPVSKLDAALPATRLEDWLQTQAGPDGRIGWDFRSSDVVDIQARFPDCVEVDATLKDGRSFFVLIDVGPKGQHPRFYSADVITSKNHMADVHRLSDLPRVLRKTNQNPGRSEVKQ